MTFSEAPRPSSPPSDVSVAELAASEARYRAIVEAQSELISLAEPEGILVYVNAAYGRHFGRSAAEMLGTNLYDLIPLHERAAVRQLIDGVLASGEVSHGENRLMLADGSQRWMAWTNSLHLGADGGHLLHSVGRDVTDRKLAEAALRESQSFLYRTGRAAGVGGWQLDLRTSALTWAEQTRRIHEVDADYVPTVEGAIAFYAPEARQTIEAAMEAGIREAKPWDVELPFITATGRRIWVRATGEAEFEDGRPVRLVGAFQDVTERRALLERVAQSEGFVRQVTDNLPVRIAYVDRELRYRFVNRAHCERFGLDREAIVGRTRAELTGVPADPDLAVRVAAALAGQTQRFEFEEAVHGAARRIESQLIPDVTPSGEVRGFFSTDIDITERSVGERALRELNAILESSADYIVQTDWRGEISYLNPAARRALALPIGGALPASLNFSQFNTPQTNRLFAQTILPAVKAHGAWVGDTTVLTEGGRVVPVSHLVIAHRDDSGRVARYSAVMRDMSAQVQAQEALNRQTAILRSVAEAIPAIVAVVGTDQRYRFVNGAFERWIGSTRERIIGRTVREVIGGQDQERSQPWIDRVLAGETVSFERDYLVQGQSHHFAANYIPLWSDTGDTDGFVGVLQDISRHRQEEVRLLNLSQMDPLTGLLNRAGFEYTLAQQLSSGGGPSLALLYIDLDRFKPVNDTHGHPVGDEVLKAFAQRLRGLVRPTDAVSRLGGDEFVVLLLGVRAQSNAEAVAAKVIESAQMPFQLSGLKLSVGASVGVAFGVGVDATAKDLLARGDAMLYSAKQGGRGRFAAEPVAPDSP